MAEDAMNAFIEKLLNEGVLVREGLDGLAQKIAAKFPKARRQSKNMLKKRVEKILWQEGASAKKRDEALQSIVRINLDPKKDFQSKFPNIPLEFVLARARWHRGTSHVRQKDERSLVGIGRVRANKEFGDLSKFEMPQTSFEKPFVIHSSVGKDWTFMVLNGSNIGTRHGRDIVGNVTRRALSDADEFGDKAIILTNIIALDLKKAGGPIQVERALVMGDNVNPKIFSNPVYRATVERIIKENPMDEIIYQNSDELLDNVLSGWTKICIKPSNKLEYNGPIFIILGKNELELVASVAYWEMNYWTKRKQLDLRVLLRVAETAMKDAEKSHDFDAIQELSSEIDTLQEQYNNTTVSFISNQEKHRYRAQALALVVRKIEQAIPNSKVIGVGNTYIEIGGEKFEINIPKHSKVTDALLGNYTRNYATKVLNEEFAKNVVICHPWALQFRMTVREADYNGKRGSANIFVAPIAVDDEFLREVLKISIANSHPLAKAVFSEQFKSGVLRLHCNNGIVNGDSIPVAALEVFKKYKKTCIKKDKHLPLYGRGPKYIWEHTATDPHWGGRAKEFVTDKDSGKRLGMEEAVFQMMRREGLCEDGRMPVHIFATNDDPTQGQNFHYRTEPDPHQRSFDDIEKKFLKIIAESKTVTDSAQREKMLEEAGRAILLQLEKRGTDFPHEQMFQMINRNIIANADVFSAILKRNQASGIIIKGVGEFGNVDHDGFDLRNVGAVNIGSGNHLGNTIDGEIIEGPFYATMLISTLLALPDWQGKNDLLQRLIKAPLYGNQTMGWGTVKTPNGYEYGLDLRATPPRMGGWTDPLFGAVRNDPSRGNYSRIFNGRMTLKTYGDKHFFGAVSTSYAFYHMCASGTHTDPYGERGFPPNNTGVSFVGLPADGPDSGPILLRILPYDVIRDFTEDSPRPFDWESFLPNPA